MKPMMHEHAERLEFEAAEDYRARIERLENYRAKSIVVNPDIGDVDTYGLVSDTGSTYGNYMRVIGMVRWSTASR